MNRYRNTYQRILIKKMLEGNTYHPSAYDIYQEIKKYAPTVSFSTVYNNLEKMSRNGELIELNDGEKKRFDPNTTEHDHFLCVKCRKIIDLPKITEIKEIPNMSFKIISHTTYIKGICDKCLEKEV